MPNKVALIPPFVTTNALDALADRFHIATVIHAGIAKALT